MFAKVCTAQRAPAAGQVPPPKAGPNAIISEILVIQDARHDKWLHVAPEEPAAVRVQLPALLALLRALAMKPQNKAVACTNAAPSGPESPITLETSLQQRPHVELRLSRAADQSSGGASMTTSTGQLQGKCI